VGIHGNLIADFTTSFAASDKKSCGKNLSCIASAASTEVIRRDITMGCNWVLVAPAEVSSHFNHLRWNNERRNNPMEF
jgi:hypothetical protein